MSAETLRRAAEKMRELAEDSVCKCGGRACTTARWFHRAELMSRFDGSTEAVPHVQAWSPAVALAVADWLEHEADEFELFAAKGYALNLLLDAADERVEARVSLGYNTLTEALAVARTFLGENP